MSKVNQFYGQDARGVLCVRASAYEALAAELEVVKKVAYGNLELMEERDAALAECERLRAAHGLVRQCIAEELESWTGDYREPVGRALHDLQQRIDAALSTKL